jgi:murein DD-endopeptidase MepM/ murein hydrolase activator NlpD
MSTMSTKSTDRYVIAILGAAALAVALPPTTAPAQNLYKYRDENGAWVYSDRRPDAAIAFEELPLATGERASDVELVEDLRPDGSLMLMARNPYHGPVQIAFELTAMDNLAAHVPTRGNRILGPRSVTELLRLDRARDADAMSVEYRFQYIHGHPGAKHAPEEPYRLPYALASSFSVSQAYPQTITHTDAASRDALDFVMPVGTGVYSARAGIVIEVASDYFESGVDLAADGPRANIVRILHDDGTMALYAHLNWNSIRVVPGQRVTRGQHLADSGNTGYTTGPHLHFVVQQNAGGLIESVPVQFRGPDGSGITVATGDHATAY